MTALHAMALCHLGRFDEAERQVDRSRELAAADDWATQVAWRCTKARILSSRGEHGEALRLIDEAVESAERTDYLDFTAETHRTRGTVLAAAGRADEARAAFDRAIELYDRKGAVPAAERVRAERASLPA
jgi:tetratricopeptide (TPR) repeat protein